MLKFLYKTYIGRVMLKLLTLPFISRLVGKILDCKISTIFIKPFIKNNNIDMSDFVAEKWTSFNDFFVRKIKDGKRPICDEESAIIAPCDGFLSVYDIDGNEKMCIKNSVYSVKSLLCGNEISDSFMGGKCLVFRLTPANYHRYCYPDDGHKGENIFIKGVLHTVRPIAFEKYPIFLTNSREYTILETKNLGTVVFMEVGAMMVGRICNNHRTHTFRRGEEKGRFEFGGSTVIMLVNDADISASDTEIPVKLGQKIGKICKK